MNFLGMGVLEIAVILLIAFLVLGPSKSIDMARTAGKVMRGLRGSFTDIMAAVDLEKDEVLIFGARRLPDIGSSLGRSLRVFKRSVTGEDEKGQVEAQEH